MLQKFGSPKEFEFESPETGTRYTSEYPVSEQAKRNTLFVERLKSLDELKRFSDIPRILLDAGPAECSQFEEMLEGAGKQLDDLLNLRDKHPMKQSDAERYVAEFFKAQSRPQRESLIERLANLL